MTNEYTTKDTIPKDWELEEKKGKAQILETFVSKFFEKYHKLSDKGVFEKHHELSDKGSMRQLVELSIQQYIKNYVIPDTGLHFIYGMWEVSSRGVLKESGNDQSSQEENRLKVRRISVESFIKNKAQRLGISIELEYLEFLIDLCLETSKASEKLQDYIIKIAD
jgi:hypothetical protein